MSSEHESVASGDVGHLAERVIQHLRDAGLRVTTVESCTGGLVAAALTSVPGSSDVVERGFVTYSNEAKSELVGVPAELIARVGAVSEDVARAMAEGGLQRSRSDLAVSITGIAGPGGGSAAKPIGLVHFALASRSRPTVARVERFGPIGREPVRLASVAVALGMLEAALAPT